MVVLDDRRAGGSPVTFIQELIAEIDFVAGSTYSTVLCYSNFVQHTQALTVIPSISMCSFDGPTSKSPGRESAPTSGGGSIV